jgi:hypothetical protein
VTAVVTKTERERGWKSLGSEKEIDMEIVKNNRDLVNVSRIYSEWSIHRGMRVVDCDQGV